MGIMLGELIWEITKIHDNLKSNIGSFLMRDNAKKEFIFAPALFLF